MVGSIYTIFELHAGDELAGTEFLGMDGGLFRRALGLLQEQGKATVYPGASADEDGVKFNAV
jgi:ESCRT-II complex subunit VPS25